MSNIPLATITMYQGKKIPAGWVLCNGKIIDKTSVQPESTFNALQLALGQSGDKIILPDLNQCFVVGAGVDAQLGTNSTTPDTHYHPINYPVKSFLTNMSKNHTHSFPDGWYMSHLTSSGSDNNDSFVDADGSSVSDKSTESAGEHNHSLKVAFEEFNSLGPSFVSGNDWSYPKYYTLNFIIYQGDLKASSP